MWWQMLFIFSTAWYDVHQIDILKVKFFPFKLVKYQFSIFWWNSIFTYNEIYLGKTNDYKFSIYYVPSIWNVSCENSRVKNVILNTFYAVHVGKNNVAEKRAKRACEKRKIIVLKACPWERRRWRRNVLMWERGYEQAYVIAWRQYEWLI